MSNILFTKTDIKHLLFKRSYDFSYKKKILWFVDFDLGYKESDDSEKVIMEPGLIAKQVEILGQNLWDLIWDFSSTLNLGSGSISSAPYQLTTYFSYSTPVFSTLKR